MYNFGMYWKIIKIRYVELKNYLKGDLSMTDKKARKNKIDKNIYKAFKYKQLYNIRYKNNNNNSTVLWEMHL